MQEIIDLIKKDIAILATQAQSGEGFPRIESCPGTESEMEFSTECLLCPYWCGLMGGGCCKGLRRTATLAYLEYTGGRMSLKRYKHRLLTLHDWLVRRKEEIDKAEPSKEDKIKTILGGKR